MSPKTEGYSLIFAPNLLNLSGSLLFFLISAVEEGFLISG
jgi:hypothetical protein